MAHGQIVIDGVNIASIGLDDLRQRITIIPQEPFLFKGTIRSNIDIAQEHDDLTLWEALRRAHLTNQSIHNEEGLEDSDWVNSSSANSRRTSPYQSIDNRLDNNWVVFDSLDTPIAENGSNLSLGQKQLVVLARALVRRSKIIIMDERKHSFPTQTAASWAVCIWVRCFIFAVCQTDSHGIH